MSCLSTNAPIDISSSNSSGKCDLKCDYKFRYQSSSCVGKNMGNYISLSYDNASSSSVTFNLVSYVVREVRIYHPSLHSFNGNKLDGEMVIVHTSNTGEMPLLVCIPIRIVNSTSHSAVFFTDVIVTMSKNAPAEGDSTTIKINNYNLNFVVPKKPFYSYTGTEPYQPCTQKVNYIVYDASEVYLDIPQNIYDNLKKIIKENNYKTKKGLQFFYNSKGANTAMSDDIYIDCQPVGKSEETVDVVKNKSYSNDYSFQDLNNNNGLKFIIGIIIFLIIIYLCYSMTSIIKLIFKNFNKTKEILNISG
jgi:carbonic anhydrase